MKKITLKGLIDYDCVNYKKPVLTLLFPHCDFKCDQLNHTNLCHNHRLTIISDMYLSYDDIWKIYTENPLTEGFCFQGLEPFDSKEDMLDFIQYIRVTQQCMDPIIIYTGYNKNEIDCLESLAAYPNIIIKFGRYIENQERHYDDVLGVKLASDNQYAELIT